MSSNEDSSAGGEASADYIISQAKNKEAGKEGSTKTTETKTTTTAEGTGGKLGAGSATSAEDPTNKWINDSGGKVTKVEGAGKALGSGDDATDTTQRPQYHQQEVQSETEENVPVMEQRLNVDKKESTQHATITKEPVTETKTVEVPVTHEEMTIERRPASGGTTTTAERPVESKTEMKVPLKKEEVQVSKEPYVKEEVSVKKKPVTETRQVSEEVTSERVNVNE
jgi:uncharacterized protein (TIGR02271 family)